MRTTISIESEMLEELVKATGARSRSAAINRAAEDYVRRKKLTELKDAWLGLETVDVRRDAVDADRRRDQFLEGLSKPDGNR